MKFVTPIVLISLLFALAPVQSRSADGRGCDIACGIDVTSTKGEVRSEIVILGCGPAVNIYQKGFLIEKASQPSGCDSCTITAFKGCNYKGQSKVIALKAYSSDVKLPFVARSAILECPNI